MFGTKTLRLGLRAAAIAAAGGLVLTVGSLKAAEFTYSEKTNDEIAKKLRVSLSKVKTDILRGREALAKILMRSGTTHEQFSR